MPPLNILIIGGGIAGPTLAYWLTQLKLSPVPKITILERHPSPRTSGQAVDIRKGAVHIMQRMGLEPAIRAKSTTEEGISFVYADGKTKASFPRTGDAQAQGFTSEFEILRGDLAGLLYDSTKGLPGVEWVFDEHVVSLQQSETQTGRVSVGFANRLADAEFDLVVGADGMVSRTRRLVWGKGPGAEEYLRSLGQYMAFFTIPRTGEDTAMAQWYNASRGRLAMLRPDQYGETRAYLAVTDRDAGRFEGVKRAVGEGVEAQMGWLEGEFVGAGWETRRILDGMRRAPDFYMQQTAQVVMDEFVKGRVALLGDAGYCPSVITGMVGLSCFFRASSLSLHAC